MLRFEAKVRAASILLMHASSNLPAVASWVHAAGDVATLHVAKFSWDHGCGLRAAYAGCFPAGAAQISYCPFA